MEYYYSEGGQPVGPVSLDALRSVGLTPETLVWHEGMTDWQPANQLPELQDLFPPVFEASAPYVATPPQIQPVPPVQPAAEPQRCPVGAQPMPPTYLVWAILTTILCFWPLGIAAIVNAAGVSSAYNQGDIERAKRRSKNARLYSIWTAVIGFVLMIVMLIVWIFIYKEMMNTGYDLEEIYDF